MRILIALLIMAVAGCTTGNPVVSYETERPAPRIIQSTRLALLSLDQGFNDDNQYIVSGRIKNISGVGVSDIKVKATLYKADGTLIASKTDYPDYWLGDLQPQAETAFSITFYWYLDLDRQMPEPDRTVFDILVDGYAVSYDNRADLPYHQQFDFRFSNWGDNEETVASNEPGEFVLNHIHGGKSTKESEGYAVAVLKFSDVVQDTVDVTYGFQGGLLVFGFYDFSMTAPAVRFDTIRTELNTRYGPGTLSDSSWSWNKGNRTFVFLFPATTWRGIRIAYVDINGQLDREAEEEYNELPLRVIVPVE